jgi:hypothetical protein
VFLCPGRVKIRLRRRYMRALLVNKKSISPTSVSVRLFQGGTQQLKHLQKVIFLAKFTDK